MDQVHRHPHEYRTVNNQRGTLREDYPSDVRLICNIEVAMRQRQDLMPWENCRANPFLPARRRHNQNLHITSASSRVQNMAAAYLNLI